MRVAVIGAGIAGLSVAAGLQAGHHDVTVFERQERPGGLGAGLTLFANALAGFETLGLGPEVRRVAQPTLAEFRAGIRHPGGGWLLAAPSSASSRLRAVHRQDLHEVLLAALRPGTLRTGESADVSPGGVPIVMTGGGEERVDLVIAADGIHSHARRVLGLDPGLRDAGYVAWRGIAAEADVDLRDAAGETWGAGRRFGIVPLPGGRIYWFATLSRPVGTKITDDRSALHGAFAGWHAPVEALIDATPAEALLRHDIRDLARPLRSFGRGRTVLIGDAAHAMTPDLGQGAGQAVEDAAALAQALMPLRGDPPGVDPPARLSGVLRSFDRVRRRRTARLMRGSRAMGRIGQLRHPGAVSLRDAALRLAMPALAASSTVTARAGNL